MEAQSGDCILWLLVGEEGCALVSRGQTPFLPVLRPKGSGHARPGARRIERDKVLLAAACIKALPCLCS